METLLACAGNTHWGLYILSNSRGIIATRILLSLSARSYPNEYLALFLFLQRVPGSSSTGRNPRRIRHCCWSENPIRHASSHRHEHKHHGYSDPVALTIIHADPGTGDTYTHATPRTHADSGTGDSNSDPNSGTEDPNSNSNPVVRRKSLYDTSTGKHAAERKCLRRPRHRVTRAASR